MHFNFSICNKAHLSVELTTLVLVHKKTKAKCLGVNVLELGIKKLVQNVYVLASSDKSKHV